MKLGEVIQSDDKMEVYLYLEKKELAQFNSLYNTQFNSSSPITVIVKKGKIVEATIYSEYSDTFYNVPIKLFSKKMQKKILSLADEESLEI